MNIFVHSLGCQRKGNNEVNGNLWIIKILFLKNFQLSPLPKPEASRNPTPTKKSHKVSPHNRDSYKIATAAEKYEQRESTYVSPKWKTYLGSSWRWKPVGQTLPIFTVSNSWDSFKSWSYFNEWFEVYLRWTFIRYFREHSFKKGKYHFTCGSVSRFVEI